jgi:hypothetical protein
MNVVFAAYMMKTKKNKIKRVFFGRKIYKMDGYYPALNKIAFCNKCGGILIKQYGFDNSPETYFCIKCNEVTTNYTPIFTAERTLTKEELKQYQDSIFTLFESTGEKLDIK